MSQLIDNQLWEVSVVLSIAIVATYDKSIWRKTCSDEKLIVKKHKYEFKQNIFRTLKMSLVTIKYKGGDTI